MTEEIDKQEYASEMRLFDPRTKERLYMDAAEREVFLKAISELNKREHRLFAHVMHWTGARPTECIELTGKCIDLKRKTIKLRTIKQRMVTKNNEVKHSEIITAAKLRCTLSL